MSTTPVTETTPSTPLPSTSVRIWRVVAMIAPLAALVIGMLLVVGSMG